MRKDKGVRSFKNHDDRRSQLQPTGAKAWEPPSTAKIDKIEEVLYDDATTLSDRDVMVEQRGGVVQHGQARATKAAAAPSRGAASKLKITKRPSATGVKQILDRKAGKNAGSGQP